MRKAVGVSGTKALDVLVLNAGSSSIKYQLVDPRERVRRAVGLVERIGDGGPGEFSHRVGDGAPQGSQRRFPDHDTALNAVLEAFAEHGPDLAEGRLAAVGHRVVHGGDRFAQPTVIDDAVEKAIEQLAPLAPLHNPANLEGIRVARRAFPHVPHVAVFDTAFHQTLPPHAHTYAVPAEWRERYGVRRYGFHGTSHQYITRRAAAVLGRAPEDVNLISLHLGNGASATAVAGGRSVETSMGMTPLEGLVMGTRSGDLDPAVLGYVGRVAGLGLDRIDEALSARGGLLALAGTGDVRDVLAAAERGDEAARLALDVYCHRIRKYVGAYCAVLGRVDAIVFTAGVGEHAAEVRARALAGMQGFGIEVDAARNEARESGERFISADRSRIAVLVIPTDEEIEIADQALRVVEAA